MRMGIRIRNGVRSKRSLPNPACTMSEGSGQSAFGRCSRLQHSRYHRLDQPCFRQDRQGGHIVKTTLPDAKRSVQDQPSATAGLTRLSSTMRAQYMADEHIKLDEIPSPSRTYVEQLRYESWERPSTKPHQKTARPSSSESLIVTVARSPWPFQTAASKRRSSC